MSVSIKSSANELEQRAAEFGRELAAALLLAEQRAGDEPALTKTMATIVMREIAAAVDWLRDGGLPASMVAAYEIACRRACREVLEAAIAAKAVRTRIAA